MYYASWKIHKHWINIKLHKSIRDMATNKRKCGYFCKYSVYRVAYQFLLSYLRSLLCIIQWVWVLLAYFHLLSWKSKTAITIMMFVTQNACGRFNKGKQYLSLHLLHKLFSTNCFKIVKKVGQSKQKMKAATRLIN